jgi:hypothetical protein
MYKSNYIFTILFYACVTSTLQAQSIVTKENLVNAVVNPNNELIVSPSKTSARNDFDFFEGKWKLRNKRLKTRLDNCTEWFEYNGINIDKKILNGIGHTNNNIAAIEGKSVEGVGLTLFNPETRLWTIYWASSRNGMLDYANPMVGSFEGNIGSFYCLEMINGKLIVVMARWDKTNTNSPVWSQAFSEDKGKTWEWNSYNYGTRVLEDEKEQLKKLLTFDNTIPIPKLHFDSAGELKIEASANSSNDDFDRLTGKWKMYHKKLKSRLSNNNEWIELESIDINYGTILNGLGNTDQYTATFDGEPFEGFTIRLFNPETKLWSLYWVASNSGVLDPPVVGSFDNDIGHFFCKDIFNGKDIIVLFRWDMRDREHPVWSQAFSPDQGKTWEWNWINVSYRID